MRARRLPDHGLPVQQLFPHPRGKKEPQAGPLRHIVHKLLRAIHSVLKNRRPYAGPGTDYREIMARRNAPRWIRMTKEYNIEYTATGRAATRLV